MPETKSRPRPPATRNMLDILQQWYHRHFTDPQTVIFAFILIVGSLLIFTLNTHLMPILIAIIIAYLAEGMVSWLNRINVGRTAAASIFTFLMVAAILLVLFRAAAAAVAPDHRVVPRNAGHARQRAATAAAVAGGIPRLRFGAANRGNTDPGAHRDRVDGSAGGQHFGIVGGRCYHLSGLHDPAAADGVLFSQGQGTHPGWLANFLPEERRLLRTVWAELDIKIASYVRGKVIEVLIIWVASYIAFALMGLNFAMLLSLAVGLSVIIPYVGATVVTIPVALIAFFQWGFSSEFGWLLAIYGLIQFLDGNLLVPLLFSEVVNLHPVAIIVAVVFFGSLWGVWGVFFAIPLATLIQAILNSWPSESNTALEEDLARTRPGSHRQGAGSAA